MDWTIGLMVINKDSYYDGAYFKVGTPKPPLRPRSPTPAPLVTSHAYTAETNFPSSAE